MLTITLLGAITLSLPDEFRSPKEIALLAYLAHMGKIHSREAVADLFWEARSTKQSLSNLRTTLTRVRKRVGDDLIITRKTLAVSASVHEQTDTVRLQMVLANMDKWVFSAENSTHLSNALALYAGDLMAGFYLPTRRASTNGSPWSKNACTAWSDGVIGNWQTGRRRLARMPLA